MIARRTLTTTGLVLLAALIAAPGAQAAGPFTALNGSWSGSGSVTLASGARERLRCVASYAAGGGGDTLRLSLRCASDSYNFQLGGDVVNRGGAISGTWSEATRNIGGAISGRASGNSIQATASGGSFAANLAINTSGRSQSVSIRASGGDIIGVDISMSRR
jgi:hypothetical protein